MEIKASDEITLYKINSFSKMTRFYLLQSSALNPPEKPADGSVISSNWSKTEPSYSPGSTSTLYFVDQTVLSDGSTQYSEVSKSSSYEAARNAWEKANGALADAYNEYYLSSSATTLEGGSWTTTAPAWVNGKYMWSRTVKVDVNRNKTYSPSQNGVCIAGAKGNTGSTGATGPTGPSGKGIKSSVITYQLCASQTVAPTGTWLNSPPKTDIATPYLWTRTVITYTDDTASTSYSVSSTFDSLMVGGRNLLLNSKFNNNSNKWISTDTGITDYVTKNNRVCAHIRHSALKATKYVSQNVLNILEPDTYYTMSGWVMTENIVKGTTNPSIMFYQDGRYGDNQWFGYGSKSFPINSSSGSWVHLTWTFLTDSVKLSKATTCNIYVYTRDVTGDIYFCDLKLEKGNVATDWSAAPEDLESRVTSAESSISNNSKEIKLKASQETVTALSEDYNVYKKTTTEFTQDIDGWRMDWNKLISTDEAEVASHQNYITFDNGDIILGESSSDLKLKLTNDSIQFKGTSETEVTPDKDATAWITGKTFRISNGEIKESLKFGDLYLTPTSDTSLAFGKIGAFGSIATFGDILRIGYYNARRITISKDELVMRSGDMFGNDNKFFQVKYTSTVNDNSYPYMILGNQITKKEGGRNSIAIGYSNANGENAMAIGSSVIVNGANSIALGTRVQSDNDDQMVIGTYNVPGDYPLIIGNGSYSSDSSARSNALTVDWDGNIVAPKLTSPGDLKLGFENGNAFKPYFTKGDTTTVTVYLQGRIVTSGKEILFYMPFSRPIIGATGVSVSSVNGIAVSQNGKSLYGSSSYVKPNAYSASIISDGHGVNIRATMPNTTNATNNATCAITASIRITFS